MAIEKNEDTCDTATCLFEISFILDILDILDGTSIIHQVSVVQQLRQLFLSISVHLSLVAITVILQSIQIAADKCWDCGARANFSCGYITTSRRRRRKKREW